MSSFAFSSRRSPVLALHGVVATSQPLASEIGLRILRAGGNAADAAVAIAAALNVTEPCSTGIGGDCFCLFYDAATKSVRGMNGSGRSPQALTLDLVRQQGITGSSLPEDSPHTVTVPGAAAGWVDCIQTFGSLDMQTVLAPAIELAEVGFPVHPVTAYHWKQNLHQLQRTPGGQELMIDNDAPAAGQVFRNPTLARTFRELAEKGKAGFYEGRTAEAIVNVVQKQGGVMTLDDLKNHISTFDDPICVNYKGVDVWEMPPNGQGLTALLALNILDQMDVGSSVHNSSQYLHTLIEAMRLAFADTRWFVSDPAVSPVPVTDLLAKSYASQRRDLIDPQRSMIEPSHGSPFASSDTVYFSVVDSFGNACSFINSNYMSFGSGFVPEGCGFTLQNRGHNFTLEAGHPNVLAPCKRSYHTIIPAMATKNGELFASFGVMGGFMQPQGHVQVLLNMIEFGMDPQAALDAPRFCIQPPDDEGSSIVYIEEGISEDIIRDLRAKGHAIRDPIRSHSRSVFGRGQIIFKHEETGVYWAGSDARADGMAIGY